MYNKERLTSTWGQGARQHASVKQLQRRRTFYQYFLYMHRWFLNFLVALAEREKPQGCFYETVTNCCHTANEGPVIIQYKCLVPIYVFQKWNCYFQNRIIMFCLPVPTPVIDLYISRIGLDRSWEYMNRSQTHECGNWDWGGAIPRKRNT